MKRKVAADSDGPSTPTNSFLKSDECLTTISLSVFAVETPKPEILPKVRSTSQLPRCFSSNESLPSLADREEERPIEELDDLFQTQTQQLQRQPQMTVRGSVVRPELERELAALANEAANISNRFDETANNLQLRSRPATPREINEIVTRELLEVSQFTFRFTDALPEIPFASNLTNAINSQIQTLNSSLSSMLDSASGLPLVSYFIPSQDLLDSISRNVLETLATLLNSTWDLLKQLVLLVEPNEKENAFLLCIKSMQEMLTSVFGLLEIGRAFNDSTENRAETVYARKKTKRFISGVCLKPKQD